MGTTQKYADASVDPNNTRSGTGYYNENTEERYYSLANVHSSMDAELLTNNAVLMCCLILNRGQLSILSNSKAVLEWLTV